MTDHLDSVEEPNADELAAIHRLLARPGVWEEPPPDLEDHVVSAIAAEPTTTTSLDGRRGAARGGRAMPWWLAAAAICAVVVAGVALVARDDPRPDGTEFALSGTDDAPDASAKVVLSSTPAGLKILLDAEGLPGAPAEFYYEAWVSDGTTWVSAGTFHLRGGDNEIELWAGVVEPEFDTLTVTLEPIDGDAGSSGDVMLRGRYDLADD